jgi:hypothetical protein
MMASPAGGESEGEDMQNEASPREMNDRIYRSLRRSGAEEGAFGCECGSERCDERVELLAIEYAARESQPLLAPGHEQVAPDRPPP